MLLLPIVDRELRVAARDWRTYWYRVVLGASALVVSLYLIWFASAHSGSPVAGMFILKAASYVTWALCLFGGVNRTADALSSEKRADTLGLLFLTHLKGHDVVLGKLLATSLGTFYAIIGLVPIFSVPVLLGGVSGSDMVRIPLVLLNSLFLAASLGLLASALFRKQRASLSAAGGTVFFLAILLPLAAHLAERTFQRPELAWFLRIPSPMSALDWSFSSAFGLRSNDFWKALAVQFGIGFVALAAACRIAPYSWKVQNSVLDAWRERFYTWTHGSSAARVNRRRRMLDRQPFFWLACRDRFAPFWPILFGVVSIGGMLWCIVYYEIPKQPALVLLLMVIAINDIGMRMRVAAVASTRLAEDRQSGALEMILSTPVTSAYIGKGLRKAIRHIQLPAYFVVAIVYGIVSAVFLHDAGMKIGTSMVLAALAFMSLADFFVLGYVGMWSGVRVHNPRHAAGSAVFRVLLVPFGFWLAVLPVFADFDAPIAYLLTGFGLWVTSSTLALRSARRKLHENFREAVLDRSLFEQKFSLRKRLQSLRALRARNTPALKRSLQSLEPLA